MFNLTQFSGHLEMFGLILFIVIILYLISGFYDKYGIGFVLTATGFIFFIAEVIFLFTLIFKYYFYA